MATVKSNVGVKKASKPLPPLLQKLKKKDEKDTIFDQIFLAKIFMDYIRGVTARRSVHRVMIDILRISNA